MRKLNQVRRVILFASFFLILVCGADNSGIASASQQRQSDDPSIQERDDSSTKIEGRWEGTIDAGGAKLRLVLHVVRKDGTLSATLDSPDQAATDLPIDSISIFVSSVRFEMKSLLAAYEGQLTKDNSQIDGAWKQQGQTFPLVFRRSGQAATVSPLHLQKVDVGGHSLSMLIGSKPGGESSIPAAPAVILEGGFGEGVASWSMVQAEIAKFAQVLSYDRAGQGQSDLGPKPRSAKQIALELHTALQKTGIKPPYVLVGHSLGGPFIRVFAGMYPSEVAGMVFVDPSQEAFAEWIKEHPQGKLKEEKAAFEKWPQGLRDEDAAISMTYEQAREAKLPAGIPVTLLTATRDDNLPAEARRVWAEKHKEWIDKVPGGKLIVTDKSDHFIQLREPQLVIEAIRQVVETARGKKP